MFSGIELARSPSTPQKIMFGRSELSWNGARNEGAIAQRANDGDRCNMYVPFVLACVCLALGSPAALARVTREQGRAPHPPPRLQAPRMWTEQSGAFSIERPDGDRWSFRGDARGPDGERLPLLARAPESGAQLIVQSADGVSSLRQLARLLANHLQTEQGIHVEDVNRLPARGGEAYGFTFSVSDEARGRVAVVRAGEHVALVIASWPMGAPPAVAEDVEAMIGSLGPPPNALPRGVF
jgi:hypothetical protein